MHVEEKKTGKAEENVWR